jgi:hypothetical protein
MGFFDKIFGEQKTEKSSMKKSLEPNNAPSSYEHYLQLFDEHLKRIKNDAPQFSSFIDQYLHDQQVMDLAIFTSEKMKLTLHDGEQHSFTLGNPPVCFWIWTLPVQLHESKNWILNKYGGYTKWIERSLNYPLPEMHGCTVFCHVVSGGTQKGIWFHIALWRLNASAPIDKFIIPVEFLTSEERQVLKI